MDLFSDPWALLSSIIIGCAGMAFFMYGKKAQRMVPLIAGILLCVYPYFVPNIWWMWGIAVAIVVGVFMMREK